LHYEKKGRKWRKKTETHEKGEDAWAKNSVSENLKRAKTRRGEEK